jgi:alpha-amylase/alpha-mannosidase (GH57 family)
LKKHVCIHGHFYQPPRENPWLEAIELQDSAYPYHDWNRRITAECYAPNAISRILDDKGRIIQMVNNYAKISFNFGPTLLAWMEKNASGVYDTIMKADQLSRERYSGHGSALAQAYNHTILPLANTRDQYTQILWGIRDFEHRFERKPEGMWLPETAMNLGILEILAEQGIGFTILAPHQARRIRRKRYGAWKEVHEDVLDTTVPYLLRLPSDRSIVLFFYNSAVSRAVAFERLLRSGESFAQRLLGGLLKDPEQPQLAHIATDGESYGHHHQFGDMALAFALHYIETNRLARLTNYGEYLAKYPPEYEVEIHENTSWSCAHGVERWRDNCGCHTGKYPEWNQAWRAPLRNALDWLHDNLDTFFEKEALLLLKDPWGARNDYIHVVLDRSSENVARFLEKHAAHALNEEEEVAAIKLLELERQTMLMFTSCGWYFDELSGIETRQILQYAGRALQLAREVIGQDLESQFLERLERAKSNLPEHKDGRRIYEESVSSAVADLKKVGANYAMCSLFRVYEEESSYYCYTVDQVDMETWEAGKARLLLGKARFLSEITRETEVLSFGALHLGDHNLNCGVRKFESEVVHRKAVESIAGPFISADFPNAARHLQELFAGAAYSLQFLFRDEGIRILGLILDAIFVDAENIYRQLYEDYAPLIRFFKESALPPPKKLLMAAEFVLNTSLKEAFKKEEIDPEYIESLLKGAREGGVELDRITLEYAFRKNLERTAAVLSDNPAQLSQLRRLDTAVSMVTSFPFQVNLWTVQNICFEILKSTYSEWRLKAGRGDEIAKDWIGCFEALAKKLSLAVGQES